MRKLREVAEKKNIGMGSIQIYMVNFYKREPLARLGIYRYAVEFHLKTLFYLSPKVFNIQDIWNSTTSRYFFG